MGHGRGRGKTNPISTSRAVAPVVLMGEIAHATERLADATANRASAQTNPICGRAERRTSAVWIRSCDEWDTGEAVEKQSQFPRHGRWRPWYSWALAPCYGTPGRATANRASAQTNPICGRAEGMTSAVWIRSCDEWDTGEALEKQSQFPRHGRDAHGTHGRDAHATEHLAASPRPCLRRGDIPARGRHCREQGFCAKQTQFRDDSNEG